MTANFDIYRTKLELILKGKWNFTPNDISVEFVKDNYVFQMNYAELAAFKTQTKINNETKINDETNGSEFQRRLKKIKDYKKIYDFLHFNGLNLFSKSIKEDFPTIEDLFSIFGQIPTNSLNDLENSFLSNQIRPQSYIIIGKLLQERFSKEIKEGNHDLKLNTFIRCILGYCPLITDSFFNQNIPDNIFFDAAKLGLEFCKFLQTKVDLHEPQEIRDLSSINPTVLQKLNFVHQSNLVFCKVQKISHCYHCIIPFSLILRKRLKEISLIWCRKDRYFSHMLNQISTNSIRNNNIYIIIHPEQLNNEDSSLLHEFITTRIRSKEIDQPHVIIISSDYHFFQSPDVIDEPLYKKATIEINSTDEIEVLYQLSFDQSTVKSYLYYSEEAGFGKTHRIHKDILAKYFKKQNSHNSNLPESYFLDANMKYLPHFQSQYPHFDLSPDLFDDNYEFFDTLWTYCTLNYHFYEDGTPASEVNRIYFEVPALTKSQIDTEFKYYDFPIPVTKMINIKADGRTEIIKARHSILKDERFPFYTRFKKILETKELYFTFSEHIQTFVQALIELKYLDDQNISVLNIIKTHATLLNYDYNNKSVSIQLNQLNEEEQFELREFNFSNNFLTFSIPFTDEHQQLLNGKSIGLNRRFFSPNMLIIKSEQSINYIIKENSQSINFETSFDYKELLSKMFKSSNDIISKVESIDYSIVKDNSLTSITFKKLPSNLDLNGHYRCIFQNELTIVIEGNQLAIPFSKLGEKFIYSLRFFAESNKCSICLKDTQIRLSTRIRTLCESIFKLKITNVSTLLNVASKLFFSKRMPKDSHIFDEMDITHNEFFPLRIQNEVSTFLENFCQYLPETDLKKSHFIFILLLRTCFYIYNMDSFFNKINIQLPRSWVIISPKNLFGTINKSEWCLFYFKANQEEFEWDISVLKNQLYNSFFKNEELPTDSHFISNYQNELKKMSITIFSNYTTSNQSFEDKPYFYFYMIQHLFLNDSNSGFSQQLDQIIAKKIPEKSEQTTLQRQILEELCSKDYLKKFPNIDWAHRELSSKPFQDDQGDGKTHHLSEMSFTIPLFKRFLIVLLNVYNGQSRIIEGFTGVGKTRIVKFLENLFNLLNKSCQNAQWQFRSIDCHGGMDIQKIEEIIKSTPLNNLNHNIFFFDELNTSPAVCNVINKMLNSTNHRNTSYLAAINPHEKVNKFSRYISRVGITQINNVKISQLKLCHKTPNDEKDFYRIEDINKLAYNVRELDNSTKMIILPSDPETFNSYDNNESQENVYLPNEEKVIIRSIIDYYLIEINTQLTSYFSSKIEKLNDENTPLKNYSKFKLKPEETKGISDVIALLIEEVFTQVRSLMNLKHILAYRDVKRFMMHFINFYRKLSKEYMESTKFKDNEIADTIKNCIIPRSIILSFMLTIAFRFSNYTRIPKKLIFNNNNEESEAFYRNESKNNDICKRLEDFGININCNNKKYEIIHIRDALMELIQKKLTEQRDSMSIQLNPEPKKWINIVLSYSYIRFSKYMHQKPNVYKTRSLMVHLFAICSCYSVSKLFKKESIMPCLIIGMPGTSKTLGINLFIDHKRSKQTIFSTTYLSTRASEAEGLNSNYRDCAMILNSNEQIISIVVIDELGLANLNENRPLKLLHYYFDKGVPITSNNNQTKILRVMSIAASNFALDYANMNRGILICTDLPSDEELIEAWDNEKILTPKHYFDEDSWDAFYSLKAAQQNCQSQKKVNGESFLQHLWELTETQSRPEKIALRPLFMLFTRLNDQNLNLVSICSYLTPVISCHPNETLQKALALINRLNLEVSPYTNDNSMNYRIFYSIMEEFLKNQNSLRSLCIRTKNYEALDYIFELIPKSEDQNAKQPNILHLFPNDFQKTKSQAADHAMKQIIKTINNNASSTIFLVIGNASFADGLLDLLNYSDENTITSSKVLLSRNGFSVSLNQIPTNLLFIFLINETDFNNQDFTDSIPVPLLDRLTQIYFDYSLDLKGNAIFDKFKNVRNSEKISGAVLWKRYLSSKFIRRISSIPDRISSIPDSDKIVSYLFADGTNFERLKGSLPSSSPLNLVNADDTSNYLVKIRDTTYKEISFHFESRNEVFRKLSPLDKGNRFELELPNSFSDYIAFEQSIIKIMDMNPQVIILTISPLMEPLKIPEPNLVIESFYDSYIQSTKQFEHNIKQRLMKHQGGGKIYIVIRLTSLFSLDHHQNIRYLLENIQNYNKDENDKTIADLRVAIIYHLKTNSIPHGLSTSLNWPLYWIDYITDSPISTFSLSTIYQSSLFTAAFNNNRSEIFKSSVKHFYNIVHNRLTKETMNNHQQKIIEDVISTYLEQDHTNLQPNFDPFYKATFYVEDLNLQKIITIASKTIQQETDNQLQFENAISDFLRQILGIRNGKQSAIELINTALNTYNNNSENERNKLDIIAKDILIRSLHDWEKDSITSISRINLLNKILIESEFFDVKRQFFDIINSALPNYVTNLLLPKLLVNATESFKYEKCHNGNTLPNTTHFFKNLFGNPSTRNKFLGRITDPSVVPIHSHMRDLPIYFPELIRLEIDTLNSMDYTGPLSPLFNTIDEFKNLHVNISDFFEVYIRKYLKTIDSHEFDELVESEDYFAAFEAVLLNRGDRRIRIYYKNQEKVKLNDFKENSYRDYLHTLVSTGLHDFSNLNQPRSDPHLLPLFYYPYLNSHQSSTLSLRDYDIPNISRYLILTYPYETNLISLRLFKEIINPEQFQEILNTERYQDLFSYCGYLQKDLSRFNVLNEMETSSNVQSSRLQKEINAIYQAIRNYQIPTYVSSKLFIKSTNDLTSPLQKIQETILHPIKDDSSSFAQSYQESFQRWLFNSKAPLLVRQVTAILSAIKNNDHDEIQREMIVMSRLLNPWNDDSTVLNSFIVLLRKNIHQILKENISFQSIKTCILDQIGHHIFPDDDTNAGILQNAILNGEMYFIGFANGKTKCNKPSFRIEVEAQIDRLIFALSLLEESSQKTSEAYKCCQFFKSISFLKLIQNDLIFIKSFSKDLQQEFVYELDNAYIILSSLNCSDLCELGDKFPTIDIYQRIQNKVNSRKQLFLSIDDFYHQKDSAYNLINHYTKKLVKTYNNVFERYATNDPILFNDFSQPYDFDYKYTLLPSLYLLATIDEQPNILPRLIEFMNPNTVKSYTIEIESESEPQTVYRTIISFMPPNISAIYYPDQFDFMGFTSDLFDQSIFSRINFDSNENELNGESSISLKVFNVISGSHFEADDENFTNFDILTYLLMLFSQNKEEMKPIFYQDYSEPFIQVTNLCNILADKCPYSSESVKGKTLLCSFLKDKTLQSHKKT